MNIYEKLMIIQQELKAPKSQYNLFGKYNYRNCEDILEAVKPLLNKTKTVLILSDRIVNFDAKKTYIEVNSDEEAPNRIEKVDRGRIYIEATAKLLDTESGEAIENTAFAREDDDKKGFDAMQLTGATSSYARKYALNGLFAIDDNKDADTTNNGEGRKKTAQEDRPKKATPPKKMTYEEACACVTTKGAKFVDLSNDQLRQIADTVKREDWKQAALLILKEREHRDLEAMAEEIASVEEKLPWE